MASRTSRRRFASRWRRSSSGVPGASAGSGSGFSSGPSETIVRYAVQVWLIAPVRTSSASTRTPTSIEVRQAALTVARRVTTSPTWMGERKRISSTAAVTTRPPARRVAAIAATSSHSFMIQPPWTLPAMFASCTPMR